MTVGVNTALQIEVDDASVVYPSVGQCRVCTSPLRSQCEELIVQGLTWKAIVASLPAGSAITARNLAEHCKREHIPVRGLALARARTQHGKELAAAAEAIVAPLAAHISFAGAILSNVSRRVASGELQPDLRDGLTAARLLAQVGSAEESHYAAEDFADAMVLVMDTVSDMISPSQFDELTTRLSRDPRLAELARRRPRSCQ